MDSLEERLIVYPVLALMASFVGTLAGPEGALWAFVQSALVLEGIYWIAAAITRGA